jgi:hypothetical protein
MLKHRSSMPLRFVSWALSIVIADLTSLNQVKQILDVQITRIRLADARG